MDVFRNMELFVEVAASGGFRAAAERLGIPNSTVSRRIAELEHDIGLRLFHRTTRRVELTEAGRLYYDRCRRITDEARLAHEELSGMVRQPTGTIRASVPVDFARVRNPAPRKTAASRRVVSVLPRVPFTCTTKRRRRRAQVSSAASARRKAA